jgi:phenylacetate-CoA ligase
LNSLLDEVLPRSEFFQNKLHGCKLPLKSIAELQDLSFTTKDELLALSEARFPFARNLTYPLDRYVRFHRTSGTQGQHLVVLDTADDWQWWVDTWQFVLDAAELSSSDHVLMAFSFGPFIGFWTAHDAVVHRGALVIPGGGLSSLARIEAIRSYGVTALFCTPSYALHLAETAHQNKLEIATFGVKKIIVAGEPGGSSPVIRNRIEEAWDACVIDHAGASEVGPWGYSDASRRGLRVIESEFIAEFYSMDTGLPARSGELAELVLTTLGRFGSPVIRYRTGDLVRPEWPSDCDNRFVLLEGGVLGRVDDMMIIRGVNVFPTAIEQILRGFPEIDEYRLTAKKDGHLDALTIEVEDQLQSSDRVAKALQLQLGLRVDVQCVPLGSLPRFEGKAKRFIDLR